MKSTIFKVFAITIISAAMTACGGGQKSSYDSAKEKIDESASAMSEKKYTVYTAPESFQYPNASLKLDQPTADPVTGETDFQFTVENYELGIQTPDAEGRGIANSGKGQHIHLIINNGPYSAHYEPTFTKELPEGRHVVLAFLSRSYHEAVKNENSYVLQEIMVGDVEEPSDIDFAAPHMFYSRPKGTYTGKDTEKLMIDFFLINTTISPDGNKVKATINGEVSYITEWAPHFVEGLEKGEVTIQLELIDSEGNWIPGPFNRVERKVILE